MACLRRDVRTGKLLIDPRRLDRVFDVVKTNVDNSASSDLYTGGKSCEVAATDYFSLWEEMQLQVEVSESLAQPAPARPHWQLLHILQGQSTGEDSDSDESGFWDLPLDWVQGSHSAYQRNACCGSLHTICLLISSSRSRLVRAGFSCTCADM